MSNFLLVIVLMNFSQSHSPLSKLFDEENESTIVCYSALHTSKQEMAKQRVGQSIAHNYIHCYLAEADSDKLSHLRALTSPEFEVSRRKIWPGVAQIFFHPPSPAPP